MPLGLPDRTFALLAGDRIQFPTSRSPARLTLSGRRIASANWTPSRSTSEGASLESRSGQVTI